MKEIFDKFFNVSNLLSFFIGVIFGITLLILFYLYQALKSLRKSKLASKVSKEDIPEEKILFLIDEAREKFKDKNLRENKGHITFTIEISKDLIYDIAKNFFPESKYPLYEITIDESLELAKYISNRINEILNRRGFRPIKKLTIARILSWSVTKKKIDESAIIKAGKKYKVEKLFKTTLNVLNIANPVYWFKKLVINTSLDLIIKKLCLVIIGIVGEETYKIYSKKVFNQEVDIDSLNEEILHEIKDDLNKEE